MTRTRFRNIVTTIFGGAALTVSVVGAVAYLGFGIETTTQVDAVIAFAGGGSALAAGKFFALV